MIKVNLKKIRKELGLSIAKLAIKLEMSSSTLTQYERGTRTPSAQLFIQLYKKLNINLNWFVSGEGEMFNTSNETDIELKVNEILKQKGLID